MLYGLKNVYYARERGHYRFGDLCFGVTPVYDMDILPPLGRSDLMDIGLYHGQLAGCSQSIMDQSKFVSINRFDGYRYVLLGDIHEHKYLNQERTIAYPGSLLQLKSDEDLEMHGLIKWDLSQGQSQYVKVPNDYLYYTLYINDGVLTGLPDKFSRYPSVRFKIINTDVSVADKIIDQLSKDHTFVLDDVSHITDFNPTYDENFQTVKDLDNIEYQKELLTDFYQTHPESIIEQILILHGEISESLPTKETLTSYQWHPKKLKFSNFFPKQPLTYP